MKKFIPLLGFLMAALTNAAEPVQPDIRDGVWQIPFRYWSHLSPVLEGTGGFGFLCEVQELGEDVPPQTHGPFRFKTGTLKVLELLNLNIEMFPALKTLKTLDVQGCEGLKVKDRVIVFVDGEVYEGGYVIDRHRGTNCLIGHRLARPEEDNFDKESEDRLIDLLRKGGWYSETPTPDELRLLALVDPGGVAESLIRDIEKGRLIRPPNPKAKK